MNELKQKWQQLDAKEKKLVSIMIIAIVIGLFYFAIWQPMHNSIADGNKRVAAQQKTLEWMQQSVSKVIQSGGAKAPASTANGSLTQRTNQAAARFKIQLSRVQPQNNELNIRIDNVDFNTFLAWLNELENQGVQATSIDLVKADKIGSVEIRKLQLRLTQ